MINSVFSVWKHVLLRRHNAFFGNHYLMKLLPGWYPVGDAGSLVGVLLERLHPEGYKHVVPA